MPFRLLEEETESLETNLNLPEKRGRFRLLEEDDEVTPQAQPKPAKLAPWDTFQPKPKEVGTLEGIASAARNAFDSSRQALDVVGGVTPEEAQNIAKIEYDKQSRKIAPGYDEYQRAEGMDAVWAFAKNPIEVTSNIIAEGLAGSLPALGAGLAAGGVGAAAGSVVPVIGTGVGFTAGQVAGTFAGSLATEYGSKILEEMQEGGVDLTKPESIQGFFENEEAVSAARDKAIKRGVPIAAFDAISAGIGGKLGRVIGKQFVTKTGEAAAELGVQAGLGGAGAVVGPLAAGEAPEGKEIFGEIIGEAGPGAAEIVTGRIADRQARLKAQEEAKIKAASELSTTLEENNAPLTANVIKSQTATSMEQDKLAADLEDQLDAIQSAQPKVPTKNEIVSFYSTLPAEEVDRNEASLTEELKIADTEEKRASVQNALDAIKEVKSTRVAAPEVQAPTIQPAEPTAQPPITDATQEIIQPEGVRPEPQDGTQVGPTEEAIVSDSLQPPARGEEEGQVVFGLRSVADNTATREQISALSEAGLVDIVKGKPVINEDGAAILAQPAAPAIVEQEPVTTPALEEAVTPEPIAEAPVVSEEGAQVSEITPAQTIAEEVDIEAGAPPLGTDNLYFENNLAQRAWRLTAGFKYDKEKGDWFHPDYPNTPRAIAEQEITEANPPNADSVRNTLQQLKVKYGVTEPQATATSEPQAVETAQPEPTTFAKGDLVRIPNRVPVYKNGQLVGGRTEMVGASVIQTMPDGKVEVRLQQGGYATLAPNEIESIRKAQPTPAPVTEQAAPAEAPAPEVAPIGRTWQTTLGQATVQSEATVGGQPRFLIKYENGGTELVRPEKLESRITSDVKMYESRQKMRTEAQALKETEQQEKTKYQDFTQSMSPMQASKAFNSLETNVQSGGVIVKRGDLVKQAVDDGAKIVIAKDGKRRLQKPDGTYRTESQVSKTAMDYADFLINKKETESKVKVDDRETNFVMIKPTPAVSETITEPTLVEQKPSKPLSVMEQANANFTKKYGMTPDEARNKFLKEKKLTSEKLNKLPVDKQKELFEEYNSWKENLITVPTTAPTPAVSQAPEVAIAGSNLQSLQLGNRVQLGKSPQTYTIEEVIPQSETEKANDEQSYRIRNEKTGEILISGQKGMKVVGGKKRKMAAKPTPLPDNERYGQVKLNRRVQSYFGGKIPDRVYVVDDAVDPEYEYKAAYYPDEGILILNNAFIRKNENIGDIIAHELGHYAFGDAKFKAAFDEFYNSLTPEEKADIDQLMGDSYNNETEESQMEERKVIAFTSFTIATPQRRSLWNAVLDAMKAFLNRVFGKNFKMSDPTRTALAMLATAKRRFAAGEEIVREGEVEGPRMMAAEAEPRRVKVGGAVREESKYITTPKGILAKNTDVIREKFFDSRNVSPENTTKAWGYISRLLDIKSGNARAFAGEINDTVDAELAAQRQALIDAGDTKAAGEEYENEIAAAMFSVELMNYAGRLAEQGDRRMIKFLNRNINDMPTGGVGSVSQAGEILRTRREYDVDGYGALKAEQQGKTDRTAATLFGTSNPTSAQISATSGAIKAADNTDIGDPNDVASEIEKVEKRTGRKIIKKIDEKIKESKNPKKDELLISFQNLNQQEKLTGVKTIYKPQKIDPAKNIKDLIIGKLVNYRKTLIKQGADGLESTFWQTMSDQERKPGPLGEIDQAQNNELAKIVQKTLIDLGLKGEPPNTKMTDIEKVASILNKQLLGEEKKILADSKIVAEIERRRQSEIETSGDEDAVNQKYDAILDAWNQAMSRQTNMPISDNMLQRLINAELKEQKFGISDLVEEADGKIVAERKNDIVKSILSRIYKVSKEAETGVEMDEDYNNLERYLSQTLNNMYDLHVQKKNAAFAKRKARIESLQSPEVKAQAVLDSLSRELDEAPPFPQGSENVIRGIVQQDLRQNPDMGREQPWKSQLTGKLLQAGATEYQAETIANLVWRQHQIKAMDRELNEMKVAAEEGSLKVIIQRIKDTPLEKQQEAGWRESVIKDYLISAGLDSKAAETAAKLYDSVISERLAEAKQKAFEDTLKRSAPWKDYLARNSRLAKDALDKIRVAIRTGVLDPEQTTEDVIANENGWTGFTKEQYQRIVQLDSIINNPENDDVSRREAMAQLNQIIVDAKLPVRFRDALGSYYVGQALMGIPTVTVNIASPIGFTVRNMLTDIGKYAFTDPARIPIAFDSFLDSMRSWYDQTSYAFKNQIYLNDVVEYLQGQNVLRELFDKGKKQWANGEYAAGFANMAVGMTQITGRVLSSLDQGAIAMLENQNITRYAMEALAASSKGKIPKDKLKEFANMVLHTKRRVIAESVASGMPRDRAGVLADLAVKSEVIAALASQDANPMAVLDASINDALLSVGRNKAITIKGAEQENTNLKDEGILSYLPIAFLENVAADSSRGGPGMQVFSKMLYGFALVPARVFHNVAWFSPYGFIRLGVDAYKKSKGQDSPYAMSLQTDAQYKQRLTEAIAGSIVMLGLAALRSGSSDEEDDKLFKIVITGNGPSATTDRQYHDSWNKKWKPYSIHIVMGDKIIPINIGRGGEALFFPIMLAGALDDWEIKKKQNITKKEPEDLSMLAEMLGSSFFALAQRGPYAAFTKPLFDASKEGRVTEELASQAGFFGKTFIPIAGTSLARNISDLLNDPVDRSSIEGAIYANTPIVGPWMGAKALNALGQPVRADDWGDRLFRLGVPVVFSLPKNTPMNEVNELILKQGGGPSFPTRVNAQKRFGDILTDAEFETYVREYGKVMSDRMYKNRAKLARMKPSDYDDELERYARGYSAGDFKVKGASDMAVQAVKRMRQ